ncbi:hypothetical protein CDL15_Pgr013677 [Punica granatum]|uniref:Uncharacterized protein n=1 Tax=Punica granatum TaxID=22663 RepID=A0A218W2D6_PUNGR|nr:hypothetical protein CDL15_Pgr013677 [Punica granatum]
MYLPACPPGMMTLPILILLGVSATTFPYTLLIFLWDGSILKRCEEDRSDEYAAGRIRAGTEDNRWKLEVGVLRASKPSGSALQLFSSSALQLSAKLKDHSAQIPGVRFVYMDIYSTFLDIIRNYTKYAMSSLRGVPLLCNQSH